MTDHVSHRNRSCTCITHSSCIYRAVKFLNSVHDKLDVKLISKASEVRLRYIRTCMQCLKDFLAATDSDASEVGLLTLTVTLFLMCLMLTVTLFDVDCDTM